MVGVLLKIDVIMNTEKNRQTFFITIKIQLTKYLYKIYYLAALKSLLPNRRNLHSAFESNSFISKPEIVNW